MTGLATGIAGAARGRTRPRGLRCGTTDAGPSPEYFPEEESLDIPKARFSEQDARSIVADCAARVPDAIETVAANLPSGFPSSVADPIFDGLRETARRI
jgi:serine/threonine-protein kinase HipA